MKDTKRKILRVALEEFATKGYKQVSTREITAKAGVNLSSIKYYFGDKEGLYRAAFNLPLENHRNKVNELNLKDKSSTEDAIRALMFLIVEPLREGEETEWCMKMRLREFIETTGVIAEKDSDFKIIFTLVEDYLANELKGIDPKSLQKLVFSILSLPMFLFLGKDAIGVIDKKIMSDNLQIDAWINKTVFYALQMINLEKSLLNT